MTDRPESVTVVSWIVIVFCCIGLLALPLAWSMRNWPMLQPMLAQYRLPYSTVMLIAIVHVGIHLACAVAWLWRLGWARHVYVLTAVTGTAFTLWATPWPLFVLPSCVYYAVVMALLYRPVANRWFKGQGPVPA
jgi:hypothetical protein